MTDPKIHTTRHYDTEWTAINDEYGGPGWPIGNGNTEAEAIEDLLSQIDDRAASDGGVR